MTSHSKLSIIGLSCASHLGGEISRTPDQQAREEHFKPSTIHLDSTDLRLPYYAIDEQFDQPERTERILFEVIEKALERSQLNPEQIAETGLFIGSSSYDLRRSEIEYKRQLRENSQQAIPMPFTGYNHLGELICEKFGINTEPFNINSACTSSANALLLAQSMIQQGRYQHAIVVGIELFNETTINGFSGLQLIAQERIAPFDKNRDGIILGESCSAVILSATERSETRLYLRGGGSSFDPYSITTSNPDGSTIAETLEIALKETDTRKDEVVAIKSHGTATSMNDISESRGIKAVFPQDMPAITAIKPYVGHTLGACGTLELVLFGQAIKQGFVPRTLNFETLDPELALLPLSEDIDAQNGVYLLNYFGFGGSNTVLVLEKV
ncbi:MAG: beta-ketoacyl synthase N-terminal-like domain-containing protein [Candidatus Thiodiazotropha sp. 6PLUC9]